MKKQTNHAEGLLESAAQVIGSTLGTLALRTGLAKPVSQPKPAGRRQAKKALPLKARIKLLKPARKKPLRKAKAV